MIWNSDHMERSQVSSREAPMKTLRCQGRQRLPQLVVLPLAELLQA